MQQLNTDQMIITDARHMPIVKHYAGKIGVVSTIDRMVDTQMELSPGIAILAMVLDTLSGRTPLYRLTEFFEEKDTELLLGSAIGAERFCDYNLGRSMDKIFETGTQKIFSQLAQNALTVFEVDPRRLHFDTTSVSVYGDYELYEPPFEITYGHSKDKRPDLKQFLVSMLCVERSIPILGATKDGNASDKTLNNELLTNISKYMAEHGLSPGAYVYVADAAFVTEDNLKKADGHQTMFLTRLPATYNECARLIRFLKDPAIVNSIFLKKAARIEVLGLVLLISLLIWRLMERSMRQYVENNDCTLPGWVRRQTKKPAAFMMTTKFSSIMVITVGQHRQLAKPLKSFQLEYLKAPGVTADAFIVP
jgi:transposase